MTEQSRANTNLSRRLTKLLSDQGSEFEVDLTVLVKKDVGRSGINAIKETIQKIVNDKRPIEYLGITSSLHLKASKKVIKEIAKLADVELLDADIAVNTESLIDPS